MFANRTIGGVKIPCVAIYIVAVLLIIAYGAILRKTGTKDPLERKIIDHPSCPGFDGWAVTHFFLFAFLGLLYPGHYLQALLVSIGWEAVEHCLGTNQIEVSGKRLQLVGDQDEEGRPTGNNEAWWYGRFTTDPCFNMAGYVLGSTAASKFWPNPDD
jgi:hypothetical protein